VCGGSEWWEGLFGARDREEPRTSELWQASPVCGEVNKPDPQSRPPAARSRSRKQRPGIDLADGWRSLQNRPFVP
jgi:hypothetical protein